MYQRDCKISSSSCVNLGALFNLIFSILLVLFVFLLVLLILCWFISVIMRVSFLLQLLLQIQLGDLQLGLIGFSVLQLGLKLGQHLGGEGEELGHLTVSVPGDDSPVTIVLNRGLLDGQLNCLSILLDHLDPGILRDGDPSLYQVSSGAPVTLAMIM